MRKNCLVFGFCSIFHVNRNVGVDTECENWDSFIWVNSISNLSSSVHFYGNFDVLKTFSEFFCLIIRFESISVYKESLLKTSYFNRKFATTKHFPSIDFQQNSKCFFAELIIWWIPQMLLIHLEKFIWMFQEKPLYVFNKHCWSFVKFIHVKKFHL